MYGKLEGETPTNVFRMGDWKLTPCLGRMEGTSKGQAGSESLDMWARERPTTLNGLFVLWTYALNLRPLFHLPLREHIPPSLLYANPPVLLSLVYITATLPFRSAMRPKWFSLHPSFSDYTRPSTHAPVPLTACCVLAQAIMSPHLYPPAPFMQSNGNFPQHTRPTSQAVFRLSSADTLKRG